MTREEALTEIKERVCVTECVNSSYVDCVDIEALRMAIKALEEEPIRCGECKYWDEYIGWCRVRNEYIFNDDFFCKYAERKEGKADG